MGIPRSVKALDAMVFLTAMAMRQQQTVIDHGLLRVLPEPLHCPPGVLGTYTPDRSSPSRQKEKARKKKLRQIAEASRRRNRGR